MASTSSTSHPTNDRAAWIHGGATQCSNEGPGPRRPWHIVLLGPPGVGKGTQAELIVRSIGACHLSTGDIFRAAIAAGVEKASPAMRKALVEMQRGALVPDDIVVQVVNERLRCLSCSQGFLLDGFPRTRSQAEALEGMLAGIGVKLDAAIAYLAADSEIVSRISGRRVCRKCKATFNLEMSPPRQAGVCDKCGGPLYQRDDDKPEVVRHRLETYHATANPVLEYYRAKGLLHEIPVGQTPQQTFELTHKVLLAV
ncbi:MAG: nucleoside monophosphate kinase [Opitutaceae bacterium]